MANFNEQQQAEALKAWWRKYGTWIMLAIAIIAIVIAGIRFWHKHTFVEDENAGNAYEQLLIDVTKQDNTSAMAQAQAIVKNYPRTGYADLAAMLLAKNYADQNNLTQAAHWLEWTITHGHNPQWRAISTLRLARIRIAQGQPQKAIAMLNNPPKGFGSAFYVTQGDAYVALHQSLKAKNAYEVALKGLPAHSGNRQMILLKLSGVSS